MSQYAVQYYIGFVVHVPQMPSIMLLAKLIRFHDDVIKWKHFRLTGPLWGEFTGDRWIPLTKANDAGLWSFLWSASEQTAA